MYKSKVVVIPCDTYEEESVYRSMKQGIDLLGGIGRFVSRDQKILVKPNFLFAEPPEKAVVTHPSVIRGMLRILQEEGYTKVTYGDSPGHASNESVARKIGLPGELYGAVQANMDEEVLTEYPDGIACKEFHFCKGVLEADAIINLCKMKTHVLERVTGAVKNVYGYVCGHQKAIGHTRFPNASVFARMLADIHRYTNTRLHIMDGIIAMEGNGPHNGNPVHMNVLLFSEDPVALDTVFCSLIYLDPAAVPTNAQGHAMGIGTMNTEEIELVLPEGHVTFPELIQRFGKPDFDADRTGSKKSFLSRFSDVMTAVAKKPVIHPDKCIRCGICVSHCPVPGKALDFKKGKDKPPVYDYKKCIRCYCCQEMCPQNAISEGKRLF